MPEDFRRDAEVIFCYTRAQALRDGVLHDVSALAREAGFRIPVAITAGVLATLNDIDPESGEDLTGRLWDLLTLLHLAARKASGDRADFEVLIGGELVALYALVGPGDDAAPVMTVMHPWED